MFRDWCVVVMSDASEMFFKMCNELSLCFADILFVAFVAFYRRYTTLLVLQSTFLASFISTTFSIPVERIPRFVFVIYLMAVVQIHYKLSCGQTNFPRIQSKSPK